MAYFELIDQRLPLNEATNVSVNTTIRARFSAGYTGEGGAPDMDVLTGFASLSIDGNTSWDNLPVLGSSSVPPVCLTPALTLLPGTVYTWTAQAYMYINQPGHGDPFNTTVISSAFTFTTAGDPPPNKPTNPTPADIGTGIVLLPTLSWEAG